jgi:hypothetical protein
LLGKAGVDDVHNPVDGQRGLRDVGGHHDLAAGDAAWRRGGGSLFQDLGFREPVLRIPGTVRSRGGGTYNSHILGPAPPLPLHLFNLQILKTSLGPAPPLPLHFLNKSSELALDQTKAQMRGSQGGLKGFLVGSILTHRHKFKAVCDCNVCIFSSLIVICLAEAAASFSYCGCIPCRRIS